jgi:replication-associated recombination protein RarA
MPTFLTMRTVAGHQCGEVTSAMQKSIRRGLERESLYWATELDLTGYGEYVWKRLRIMASEDVGLADSNVAVQVRALYENWLQARKNKADKSNCDRLFLTHAVLILVRAPKSRIVDHSLIVTYEGERPKREIPDWALDKHTGRGRAMGRGAKHFFDVGGQLRNRARLVDRYEEEARKIRTTNDKRKPAARVRGGSGQLSLPTNSRQTTRRRRAA